MHVLCPSASASKMYRVHEIGCQRRDLSSENYLKVLCLLQDGLTCQFPIFTSSLLILPEPHFSCQQAQVSIETACQSPQTANYR